MNLVLFRKTEINNTVLGELHIDNKFFCYTLEDKIRDVKIKHQTCIPQGTYEIVMTLSQRFKTVLPLLLNVPNFEGIRIHAGNTTEDTSGCLLVGSSINNEVLLHSKTTLQKLLPILQKALKVGPVTIEICNPIKASLEPELITSEIKQELSTSIPLEIKNADQKSNILTIINQLLKWLIKYF